MSERVIDCRSEVGVTIGLIDGIIAIARVLVKRELSGPDVAEALADLRADEDVACLLPLLFHETTAH